ncbi:MAG: amino acid adenylation domain-containing protein [Candidatus Pedobacter colombiensis]|uniref:Amino acid adenylation domain-containing protein n=1 Tax=Candidatus Pedobacter colombiensis TaxID=3121371 RepID=A0AAJ5W9G9_9SPHI|nr:amino acid adenylation domain-containing protein [Pedobacter sp.]WEK21233.1 MAG: amino acid adenylation domain-containing protein [Pedobacter sp.]
MIDALKSNNFIEVDFNPFEEGKEIEKVIALNESQKEIWLSCIIGGTPASLAYNESISLELKGEFDINAFQKAVKYTVLRHEALRANVSHNGESLIIYKEVNSDIIFKDISSIDSSKINDHLSDFVNHEISIPFNLYNEVLFKIFLHKVSNDKYYLTIIIHHIIGDGWSIGIIMEDLSTFYNVYLKNEIPTPNFPAQISKYALEQAAFSTTEDYEATQKFWLDLYKDDVPVLNMPLDYNRPPTRTYEGKRNDYRLDNELFEAIKKLSAKANCSVVSTLITAFEVFLYHQTNQEDIVLGLPSAGQLATENLDLVGHCVNLLPLRSKVTPNVAFIDYLKKRKNEIYDAYDHQKLTFSELLKKLNIKRNKANIPLVPVVFNVDRGMDDNVDFKGLTHKIISNPRVCQTFEISLNVNGSKGAMIFEWAYNTQLFASETINRMMEDFSALLKTLTSNPEVLISASLVKDNPFPEVSPVHCDFPRDQTIVDLFLAQVNKYPQHKAVTFEGKSLSYDKLNAKSNQLANYLISLGIKKGSLIPICLNPSLEMIVAIFGVLKAGAAYVPIDPEYPLFRINHLYEESKSNIIISDKLNYKKLQEVNAIDILVIDEDKGKIWRAETTTPPVLITPNDLIYIIYTSGSTGFPKGVMIEHSSIMDYLFGLKAKLPILNECKTFALGSAISTDLGNTTLFSALTLGAELHIFAKDRFNHVSYIHDYFKKTKIDFLKIVPSHWKFLTQDDRELFPEKLLMFGGESLPGEFIKKINESGVDCTVVNHYGPTETTIGKLLHVVNKDKLYLTSVPIGRPFSNTSIYVLNKDLKYCPIGVPGELHIGGAGVARGYLDNQELTQKFFISNPTPQNGDHRMYKTGDLVKWLPDGNIQYLGRIDDQIKIRGNRIEIGEIQNVLQKHQNVKQSAVLTEDVVNNEKQLIAYLVTDTDIDKESIIAFMRDRLPDYMIPRILIRLPEIPLTSNGKVDRNALPKRDILNVIEENTFIPAQNKDQELIAKIWAESLGLKQVSITDDFFELGGHSMIAIKVMVEIEKQTGIRLPLAILFDNSTVEKLALNLSKPKQGLSWDSLIPIKGTGNKPPLYIIHGQGMNIIIFKSLLNEIDKEQPILGIQPKGLNPEDLPHNAVENIAGNYVSEIIKNDPEGPYLLMGYSSGGTIALEMAEQFNKMGKKVSFLALLDTYYDGDSYISLIKDGKILEVLDHAIKSVGCAFLYFSRYPKAFIEHKINFTLGTLYNYYKKIRPIKEDLSNPLYILDRLQKAHQKAFKKYRLKKYNIDVTLFKANDKKMNYISNMQSNGLAPYIGGKLTYVDIPLEHLQFFDPKYVHIFAAKLQEELNKITPQ